MSEKELFKEAVMKYLVDDAQVMRACKAKKPHRALRRAFATAACLLLVAAASVLAIPSARAAVSEWLLQWFSATDYIGQERENRDKEPAIEAIITQVEPEAKAQNRAVITKVSDDPRAQTAADAFGVRLDEVAYDGNAIYVTGWFTGTSGKFLLDPYTGGDTVVGDGAFTHGDMQLTMPDGATWYGVLNPVFDEEMRAYVAAQQDEHTIKWVHDEAGNVITSNAAADAFWYEYLKDHEVRFTFEAPREWQGAKPISGTVEAKLSFREYHTLPNADGAVDLFAADLGTVTIDADAYKSGVSKRAVDKRVRFSGTHRMYVGEWVHKDADHVYIDHYVSDLDMSGVALTVESLAFTPTGPELAIRFALPEAWTRAERVEAAQSGIKLLFFVDGQRADRLFRHDSKGNADHENAGDPFTDAPRVYRDSTLPPSEWDNIKTLTIVPCVRWPDAVTVTDIKTGAVRETTSLEPGVTVTTRVNYEGADTVGWNEDIMNEFAVTLNLDDYR